MHIWRSRLRNDLNDRMVSEALPLAGSASEAK